jgi:hypothetical protein
MSLLQEKVKPEVIQAYRVVFPLPHIEVLFKDFYQGAMTKLQDDEVSLFFMAFMSGVLTALDYESNFTKFLKEQNKKGTNEDLSNP